MLSRVVHLSFSLSLGFIYPHVSSVVGCYSYTLSCYLTLHSAHVLLLFRLALGTHFRLSDVCLTRCTEGKEYMKVPYQVQAPVFPRSVHSSARPPDTAVVQHSNNSLRLAADTQSQRIQGCDSRMSSRPLCSSAVGYFADSPLRSFLWSFLSPIVGCEGLVL